MTTAMSGARLGAVLAGAAIVCAGGALVVGGGALVWSDRTARTDGLFTSGPRHYDTAAHALVGEHVDLPDIRPGWLGPDSLLGTVRLDLAAGDGTPMFLGVASSEDVRAYLDDVSVARVDALGGVDMPDVAEGRRTPPSPSEVGIWTAATSGSTPLTLTFDGGEGDWSVVVMRPDASAGLDATVRVSAEVPRLPWLGTATVAAGVFVVAGGMGLILIPLRREARREPSGATPSL